MANPKEKETAVKQSFFKKVSEGCKKFFKRIGKAFKDMYLELKKVSWPDKKTLLNYTLVVLAFMVVMGLVILGIDSLAGLLAQTITA